MNLFDHLKFALSRPPRAQIKFFVTTFIDNKISKRFYGKSLLGNFLQILYTQMTQSDSTNFAIGASPFNSINQTKGINGSMTTTYNVVSFKINGTTGDNSKGLVIGIGTAAVTTEDYKLATICANGTGANQFSYQIQTSTQGTTPSGLTTSFILQRLFINNSGSQIDVTEIALYSYASASLCIYRDLLSAADEVPNGSTYRVTLEISITS